MCLLELTLSFSRYIPRSGITGLYSGIIFSVFCFFFLRKLHSPKAHIYIDPWYMFLLTKHKRHILIVVTPRLYVFGFLAVWYSAYKLNKQGDNLQQSSS